MITAKEAKDLMKESLSDERKEQLRQQLNSAIIGAARLGMGILVLGPDMKFNSAEERFVEHILEERGFSANFMGPTRTITW